MPRSGMTFELFGKDVSASRAIAGVGKTADKVGGGFAGTLGKGMRVAGLALASAGAAAGAGIAVGLVKGFGDAAAYQTLAKQTAAVLKSTGNVAGTSVKGVQQLAGSLESLSGVDEDLIVHSQNVMLTFKNVRNEAGKGNDVFKRATQAALNMSTALGQDLQGSTVLVGKALNDPIRGLTYLTRVGVSFTDAQEKQIKGLAESGHLMKAQKIILRELGSEFGGAAKAAGSGFNGAMARLQDTISDTFRDIATNLLPVATKLVDWIRVSAIPWTKQLVKWFSVNLGPAISKVGGWISTTLVPALVTAGQWVMSTLVPAIAQLYQMMWNNLQPAVEALGQFWRDTLQPALHDSWPTIVNIAKALGVATGAIMVAVSWIVGKFVPALTVWWRALFQIGRIIAKVIAVIIDWGTRSVQTIKDIIQRARDIIDWFRQLPDRIGRAVRQFPLLLLQAGRDLITGLINGVKGMLGNAVDAVKNVGSSMVDGFKSLLHIGSPSKVFERLGLNVTEGLVNGLRKGKDDAFSEIKSIGAQIVANAKSALAQVRQDRGSLRESMVSASGLSGISASGESGIVSTADVIGGFAANASRLKSFATHLGMLRRMGLRPDLVMQLLNAGPEQGGQIADAILAGGTGAIRSVNASQAAIAGAAGGIARTQYAGAIGDARGDLRRARKVEQHIKIEVKTPDAPGAGREIMKLLRQYAKATGDRLEVA